MDCPPIYWKAAMYGGVYGTPYFASLHADGSSPFASVNECVDDSGLWSVKIRRGHGDLYGYAGSLEQAKRHVERWARRHWRTVDDN